MKVFGWICVVVGALSFLGAAAKGNNVTGPTFWLALGIFLLYRVSQKKKEKEDADQWDNGNSQQP